MTRVRDGIKEKYCTKCESWKSMGAFGARKDLPDGKQCYCKVCVKAANAAAHIARREKEAETNWHSSEDWLINFAMEYNSKHPVDNWFLDRLVSEPARSPWEVQTAHMGAPVH